MEQPLRGAAQLRGGEGCLGELPLRGAACLEDGEGSFCGSCRCAGLLD